ncbi:hypothetical protein GCM10022263_14530 [Nocardioides daeguensis]|uniref:Uncharacterized protein n=1 Tax=Nocardioides daeguensis TaxID=908359 RepID=A0ABP6V2X0_9ACTN
MDHDQLDRVSDVDRLVGVLGEQDHHQGEVPGVLGVVLATIVGTQPRRAKDRLQLVGLGDEAQLRTQTFGDTGGQWLAIDEQGVLVHGTTLPASRDRPAGRCQNVTSA